jgi:integrase/recombinase XerD
MPISTSHPSLPVAAWPEADRRLWLDAAMSRGPLDDARFGITWTENTRKGVGAAYGRWLGWLVRYDSDALALPAAARASRERIARYQRWLADKVGDVSVSFALLAIFRALRAMCGEIDLRWLSRLSQQVHRRATPKRDKRGRIVHSAELREFGIELMRANRPGKNDLSVSRLIKYRDGLIISFLAMRPLRVSNIIGMRLGTNLVQRNGLWWIYWPPAATKNVVEVDLPFPHDLLSFLETYLEHIRPLLLRRANGKQTRRRASPGDFVWIASTGGTLSKNAMYAMTRTRTLERFGVAVNPHLFRDCLSWTLEQADLGWTIPHMLGHKSHTTSEMHYNRDWGARQQRLFHQHVAALRKGVR